MTFQAKRLTLFYYFCNIFLGKGDSNFFWFDNQSQKLDFRQGWRTGFSLFMKNPRFCIRKIYISFATDSFFQDCAIRRILFNYGNMIVSSFLKTDIATFILLVQSRSQNISIEIGRVFLVVETLHIFRSFCEEVLRNKCLSNLFCINSCFFLDVRSIREFPSFWTLFDTKIQ